MRYRRMTALGVAALMLAGAPVYAYAQSTTDQQQSTTEKPGTMQKMEQKAKGAATGAKAGATDSWVTSKVKIALFADERVKGHQVSVSTTDGTVWLRGKVDSEEAKMAAADIAKGVEHVKGVRNELQVVPAPERAQVNTDDKAITTMVEKRLKTDPQLKSAHITARVDAGIVTLTGQVKSIMLSSRASEILGDVPGVKAVRNDLTYQQQRTSSAAPAAQE